MMERIRRNAPFWAVDVAALIVMGALCLADKVSPGFMVVVMLAILGFKMPGGGPPTGGPSPSSEPRRKRASIPSGVLNMARAASELVRKGRVVA